MELFDSHRWSRGSNHDTLYECRDCGKSVAHEPDECPECGSDEIACYHL